MKIIKDKQITEDSWTHLADNDTLSQGDITLSLSRWTEEKEQLKNYQGNIGVRIAPSDNIEEMGSDLKGLPLIAVDFPAFTDGRAFSHARLLRERLGYIGEVRAVGSYMADQVFYLTRVGVNAFEFDNENDLETALSTINDFSVTYQSSSN